MIASIELCFQHARRVKGPTTIHFSPGFNILVGPNGSGKSTVLRALHSCEECGKAVATDLAIHYFNAESMNPHQLTGPVGSSLNMLLRVRGLFSSHGEIMKAALVSLPLKEGDVLLVDEPETGQDFAGIRRIRAGFEHLARRKVQVIAATHHPGLLDGATLVELETGYASRIREEMCRALLCAEP
jgi:energy-coupling factor transporter ATP-binding protein EcfA2